MKKNLLVLAAVVLVFAAAALVTGGFDLNKPTAAPGTPNARVPSLMVNGVLYQISPEQDDHLESEPEPSDLLGTVTSQVPLSQLPTQDGESNSWPVGAAIATCEKGIAVQQGDGAWRILVPAETREN